MRATTLLLLLVLIQSATALTLFPSGSCDDFRCYIPSGPFYTNFSGGGGGAAPIVCTLSIALNYPTDGSTFYDNTITINTTLSGNTSNTTCWYTENGLGNATTNNFNCENKTITFPSGDVELIVYALDDLGCSSSSQSDFQVILFNPTGSVQVKATPVLLLVGILMFLGTTKRRKKKRGTQTQF